jgi:hypothetical protein
VWYHPHFEVMNLILTLSMQVLIYDLRSSYPMRVKNLV